MPSLQRSITKRGPRFYEDGGKLMFVNVVDGSTRDGPRVATAADKKAHPAALAAMGTMDDGLGRPLVTFQDPESRAS